MAEHAGLHVSAKQLVYTPQNNVVSFLFYGPMGREGQSFRLACLAGKNPGGKKPPAIERPSFGRGRITAKFMRVLRALRAGYGERLERHMGEPSKLRDGKACRATRFCKTMRVYLMIKGVFSVLSANGSRGSVFQTGLPCRQESGGLKAPAIKRPSFGRGCITSQFMRGLWALRAGYGERLKRHMGEPSKDTR